MDNTENYIERLKSNLDKDAYDHFNQNLHPTARKSAVCILLYSKQGKTNIGMIKRNKYPGVHSQQIGFPGGKVDESDLNLWETANRELFEELGIHAQENQIINLLKDIYIPPSNFLVRPFVIYFPELPSLTLDKREVQYFVEFPLEYLFIEEKFSTKSIQTSDQRTFQTPVLLLDNDFIWGASFSMLMDLKKQIINNS